MAMIRFRSKRKGPSLKRQLDRLWSECVKARAGGRSELSGKPGHVAHHAYHKANLRLRYDLDNGIWITNPEHCKVTFDERCYDEQIKKLRGADFFDRMAILRQRYCKTDLKAVKIMLENELRKYA